MLLEKEDRLGGHSNTLQVERDGGSIAVDTGFIVYNEHNYPELTALLAHLGVETEPSCMSFSASLDGGALEYSGASARSILAQKSNLLRPRFVGMLVDIVRFNRQGRAHLRAGADHGLTLRDFLDRHRLGETFRRAYLLPMAAAIWSAPTEAVEAFPASSLLHFFDNHGLLTVDDQPDWRTLRHRSADYVARIAEDLGPRVRTGFDVVEVRRKADGVSLRARDGSLIEVDEVVLATHADQSLAMMADADEEERAILGAFRFQKNTAVLHSDPGLMPKRPAAWASWNYVTGVGDPACAPVSVTYWMNRLQNLDERHPLFVSLNSTFEPRSELVEAVIEYTHPLFDLATLEAQSRMGAIQGRGGIHHAGAWLGHGFHEDGLRSGIAAAHALGCAPPWRPDAAPDQPQHAAAAPA